MTNENAVNIFSKDVGGFKKELLNLRNRFYTKEEFPSLSSDSFSLGVLREAVRIPRDRLSAYSCRLRGKDLDALMLELKDASDEREVKWVASILLNRWSKRLAKLMTVLYQHNYDSFGLNRALHELSLSMAQGMEKGDRAENAFIRGFGNKEDKINAACLAIYDYDMYVDRCFADLKITAGTPFAKQVVYMFLGDAPKEGIEKNRLHIVKAIESLSAKDMRKIVNNYLLRFNVDDFDDGINLTILHKLGRDFESAEWQQYDAEPKKRFARWVYLHELKIHSLPFPKKYEILSKYRHRLLDSRKIALEDLMIMDFGDLVIADVSTDPFSHFCEKRIFEEEMEAWKKESEEEEYRPIFLTHDRKSLSARDFIIEEKEDVCIMLSYEGIDALYIREMLDIKMGLEPDMRRRQLAKLLGRKV